MSSNIPDQKTEWRVFGCTRIGFAHQAHQHPCQDAHQITTASWAEQPYLMVAVADGHGDKRHDLSQYGAELAVQCAGESFQQLLQATDSASTRATRFQDWPADLHQRWLSAVFAHQMSGEASQSNTSLAPATALPVRYGTTLLATLVYADQLFCAQLGDGDLLWLLPNGRLERPFAKPAELIGTETYSLCMPEAATLLQTAILPCEAGGLLLLATDGLSDSFVSLEAFETFVHSLRERIFTFGFPAVCEQIPKWLDYYSEQGSGDDMTLVLVHLDAQTTPGSED